MLEVERDFIGITPEVVKASVKPKTGRQWPKQARYSFITTVITAECE